MEGKTEMIEFTLQGNERKITIPGDSKEYKSLTISCNNGNKIDVIDGVDYSIKNHPEEWKAVMSKFMVHLDELATEALENLK